MADIIVFSMYTAVMEKLKTLLKNIDGRGYKTYRQLQGTYYFDQYMLFIDHAQSDPFAPPSAIRINVPMQVAGLPDHCMKNKIRRIASADFLSRIFQRNIKKYSKGVLGTGNSGVIQIDAGGQEVLERTCMVIFNRAVEARIQVGLPAFGRRVNAKAALSIFFEELPRIVESSLFMKNIRKEELNIHTDVIENQEMLRNRLTEKGLVAFIGNGALLPRQSGISDRPMAKEEALLFQSPETIEVEVVLHSGGKVKGMGIPKGVTLIVGGGYHGKSTLLKAIERGIYNHIPGDGRECVVTVADAVKIRAEDGRSIEKVDISPFISNLPFGRETTAFSSDDASGSTSQAANIIEAIETGTSLLLIDEDTSATNFMVRDARMQMLVAKAKEPITPFIDRVQELSDTHGISTIIVMGGSGDYFSTADHVIMMDSFTPMDVTAKAREIVMTFPSERKNEITCEFKKQRDRIPQPDSFPSSRRGKSLKVQAKGLRHIRFEKNTIELSSLEQLTDVSQTRGIAAALVYAMRYFIDGKRSLREIVDNIMELIDEKGPDCLCGAGYPWGDIARPGGFEIAAAVNRLRGVRMKQRR